MEVRLGGDGVRQGDDAEELGGHAHAPAKATQYSDQAGEVPFGSTITSAKLGSPFGAGERRSAEIVTEVEKQKTSTLIVSVALPDHLAGVELVVELEVELDRGGDEAEDVDLAPQPEVPG